MVLVDDEQGKQASERHQPGRQADSPGRGEGGEWQRAVVWLGKNLTPKTLI